uniref:Uncharacterized protein n=1 Tax=Pasiphaea japonica whispovirus TaxID=2984286 RepID=A0A9C7C0Q0_9VIRU|nr:MAG: hypothetical protein [Pasiphaea japonica whispovirus]
MDSIKTLICLLLLVIVVGIVAFTIHQSPIISGILAGTALIGTLASLAGGGGATGKLGKAFGRRGGNKHGQTGKKNKTKQKPTNKTKQSPSIKKKGKRSFFKFLKRR